MNILSKNMRLLLLATLLCLHVLAVPAMGDDSGTTQNLLDRQGREKKGRPDGQGRTEIRSERHEGPRRDGAKDVRMHSQDRQGRAERQERVRSEARSAPHRDKGRGFEASARTARSSNHDASRPPAEFKRRDAHREADGRDHRVKQADTVRQSPAAKPRSVKTTYTNHSPFRQPDRGDDRVRRTYSDSRSQWPARAQYPQVRHDKRPVTVKRVVHKIPERHTVVVHGRERYHYHRGRFYRPWNSGFILVRPPLGLIMLDIPIGSRMVISAGITYHVFGDVYYRRVPAGYQVVEPIRAPGTGWPDRVEVIIDLLNVRYGPQENEEVIAQVNRYATLRVLGGAPGWLYVEVEGEDVRGWVMERYVASGSALG